MAVIGCALVTRPLGAQPPEAQRMAAGKKLYEASCAACHGIDGRGAPRATVGFDIPLPDFTDCGFGTREPNEDWLAVVHDGGPARAFDPMMPAFRDALTPEEMELTLDYIRAFCGDDAWPRGELNLPRLLITTKAYPEDEAVLTVAADSGAVTPTLVYERRIGARNQIEVAVPFVVSERISGGRIGGVGDIALSAKRAVFHSIGSGSILSVALELVRRAAGRSRPSR
jgi:hypothetical protein